ncbi:MAG: hypothetical protein ACM3MH_10440 [Actinomycetota bacterium]
MRLQVFTSLEDGKGFYSGEPPWSLGDSIYLAAAIFALLLAAIATVASLYGVSESEPVLPLDALFLAAIIWLIGYICRRVLKGL